MNLAPDGSQDGPEDGPLVVPVPVKPAPARSGRGTRDRHDRGMRAPAFGKAPLVPGGVPASRSRAERFDELALRVMRIVVAPWADRLGDVELAVEEVPVIPPGWSNETVPLASYVEAGPDSRPRLVLFRRPLEHRAEGQIELETLLLTVLVEQVAEVLGIPAEDVHPGYETD